MALTKVSGDFIKAGSVTQAHLHSSHGITTSHLTEGDKLFFTNARVDSRIGSLSSSDLSEGTNLYYTDARARAAISGTGSLSYNSTTGVMSFTMPAQNTSNITEGTNLYYTDARADARITAASTSDLSEGTNLYYTDARADARITASDTDSLSEGSTNLYYTDARADARVALIVDSSPAALNTLNELAAALGDDANFSTTITTSIGTKWTEDSAKITNWDTAYGWGDHGAAGYLTSSSTQSKYIRSDADDTASGIITLTKNTASNIVNNAFSHARTIIGGIHFANGAGTNNNGKQAAITFQGSSASEAQAGIYVHNNNSQGTHMLFATTDSYATGPQAGITLLNNGNVTIRGTITASGYNKTNWDTAYGWGNHASAGYITSFDITTQTDGKYLRSNAADTATHRIVFSGCQTNNHDTIATASGSQGSIEIFNTASGNDAFMAFHAGGDYALYFGLDADTNKLAVGGWSMGASKYAIYHEGNKPSLADLGYSGATNANYITNNNQLTNGAGYLTYNIGTTKLSFNSGSGGATFGVNHYTMGVDIANGAWSSPNYSDLIIGYHTGIRIGAAYGGTRFYANSPTTDTNNTGHGNGGEALIFTVGGAAGTNDTKVEGIGYAGESFRAPIFYDSNDTSYYADPNGTSRLYHAQTPNGSEFIHCKHSGSDFANGTLVTTDIPANTTSGASYVIEVTGKSYSGEPPFAFKAQGYLYNNTIINHSGVSYGKHLGGNNQIKVFNHSDNKLAFWWPRVSYWNSFEVRVRDSGGSARNRALSIDNSTEPSSSKKVTTTLSQAALLGHNYGSGSLYSDRMYDQNDTSFYVDPNSTSYLSKIWTRGSTTGNAAPRWDTSFHVAQSQHFYGHNSTQTLYFGESNPAIFGSTLTVAGDILVNGGHGGINLSNSSIVSSRTSSWTGNPGTEGKIQYHSARWYIVSDSASDRIVQFRRDGSDKSYIDNDGRLLNQADARGYVFYDQDDTNYYFDPNSTTLSGKLRSYLLFNDYGAGIIGSYSSYRYQLVFAMGNSYKGALDGTSVSGGYGLWYSHPNAGGVAANLSDHGLMNIVSGTWHASLASSTRASSDMRAPIFYDLNNTGYYVDPASTTVVNDFRCDIMYDKDSTGYYIRPGSTSITNDFRATIFYARENTTYYTRPHTSSYINSLHTAGSIQAGNSGTSNIYMGGTSGSHFRFHCHAGASYFDMNAGNINWRQGSSTRFIFYSTTANMTVYGTVTQHSDLRIKDNVVEIPNCIDKVKSIRGIYYNRTDFNTEPTKIGVVAQEVEVEMPELVHDEETSGIKSVSYTELTAVLVNAIKEQQTIIDDLKTRLETLENQ